MKRLSKKIVIIISSIIVIVVVGYFIWQKYKYKIVRNSLTTTVKQQTDSLYSIKYDSLSFDGVTGHATMINVRIIPDTDRVKNLSVENMPDFLLNVTIKSLVVTGVQTAKALQGNKMEGDSVIINNPEIIFYSLKPLQKKTVLQNEANSLYRQILGKLDLIKVGFVFVNNVHIKGIDFFSKENNFELVNGKFVLEDVLIDSSHNLDSNRILFCKQAAFTVDSFFSFNHDRKALIVKQVHFLGKQQKLSFNEIIFNRFTNDSSAPVKLLDAKNLALDGVNTNEIVKNKNFFVDTILCSDIVLYELPLDNLKTNSGKSSKPPDSTGFSNVYSIYLKHLNFPKLTFVPFEKSSFSIGNISIKINQVNADRIIDLENHPMDYTKEAEVAVDRFSIQSKDKTYHFNFKNILVNSLDKELKINSFDIVPFSPEQKFANSFQYQKDRYDVSLGGISLKNIDMNSLLDKKFIASEMVIDNLSAKIYRDLHKPLEHKSKVGNYPSQMLMQLGKPIDIAALKVNHALVEYRENEITSDSIGVIKFSNSTFNISNITNMPEAIKKNNEFNIAFESNALGSIPLKGNFKFLLDSKNGDFFANGHAGAFSALKLNQVSIPMALIKINSGNIKSIDFHFTGNNAKAKGKLLMNYDNMKVDVLKRDKETKKIKKRGFLSFAANIVVNNSNSGSSVTPEYDRDIYKSFFNLVWKTMFTGMKKTLGVP